jgi:SAM-dependent methyltransferase
MNDRLERIYARYSEVRPGAGAPRNCEELLDGRQTVYRKVFVPWLPAARDARILDLGCGYGEFVYFLQNQGYGRATGIDLNLQQVEVAERLGVRNIRRGDAQTALTGSGEEFDCITAIDVLEHVPKDQVLNVLDLIHHALRRGGRFICQVPNLAAFYSPYFYMDFSHETPFTGSSLKQALELADFANVRVLPRGPVVYGVKSAVRFVLWKMISSGLRFVQTVEGGPHNPLESIYTATILAVADKP